MRAARLVVGLMACGAEVADDTDAVEVVGCAPAAWRAPPACGTGPVDRGAVFPGPAQAGYDAGLDRAAQRRERMFQGVV